MKRTVLAVGACLALLGGAAHADLIGHWTFDAADAGPDGHAERCGLDALCYAGARADRSGSNNDLALDCLSVRPTT